VRRGKTSLTEIEHRPTNSGWLARERWGFFLLPGGRREEGVAIIFRGGRFLFRNVNISPGRMKFSLKKEVKLDCLVAVSK